MTQATNAAPRQIGIRQRSLRRHCRLGRATELVFILATGATLVLGGQAQAQSVWDGSSSLLWTDAANWSTNAVPGSGDAVELSTLGISAQPVILGFDANAGTLNIATGQLRLQPNGGTPSSLTVANGVTMSGGNVQVLGNTSLTSGGFVATGGLLQIDVGGTHTGALSLTNATVDLSGTQTGTVTLNAGSTLNGGTTSIGNLVVTGAATLSAKAGETLSQTGSLNLVGGALTIGSATNNGLVNLRVNGAQLSTGDTINVAGGTLQNHNSGALNQLLADIASTTLQSGTFLDINGLDTGINVLGGAGTVTTSTAAARVLTLEGTSTFSGVIEDGAGTINLMRDSVGMASSGTGTTTTLTGANTYTGTTTVNQGTLAVTGGGTLASTNLTTGTSGTFRTDGGALLTGTTVANAGIFNLTGAEAITSVNGTGAVSLNTAGDLTVSDDSTIGTLTGSGTANV